jgi:diguanylate cyclase (GGDEF)-like protein
MSGITRFAFVLLILTGAAILGYHTLMDKVLVISPSSHFHAVAINDTLDGGHSVATLETTDSSWLLHYEIRQGYAYPYATLSLFPPASMGFLDLSHYDSIQVKVRFHSQQPTCRIRVQFRNINPIYTRAEIPQTMKYNEVQYDPRDNGYPAKFVWGDFRVPVWWSNMVNSPYWLSRTEVTNVSQIDITTPEVMPLGSIGSIEVVSLSLYGKQIAPTLFYQCVLGIWVLMALLFLIVRTILYSRSLRAQEIRERELRSVNDALSLRSREMENMAKQDSLTNLLNRHGLRDHLVSAMDKARSGRETMSVIMVDIDHFKKINDSQGHARGDEILREVALTLKNSTRTNDCVARWGGEEFLILCPATQLHVAAMVAEKLRRFVEGLPSQVTCSFGVAEFRGEGTASDLIQRADQALYRAKESGRNQVQRA